MHKLLGLLATAAFMIPAAALAQAAPSGGGYIDIRNSDLGAHDSFSTPDLHDQVITYRQRELSEKLQAMKGTPGPSRPAKASELAVGTPVNDKTGIVVAKIEEVDADGVVVSSGSRKIKVPADAFGHNKLGLLLDMSKAEFDAIVSKANGAS